jgi:uncharacterized small protein (DUF1192 family)
MANEPDEPRAFRGKALLDVTREDLEVFGVDELAERIEMLEGEIARVRAQMQRKQAGRAAADALFSR